MALEFGLFVMMIAFSFGFMIWGFLRSASLFTSILRIISIAVFMGLALFVGSGQEVSATTTNTVQSYVLDSNNQQVLVNATSTQKNIIIPEGQGMWFSYLFMGFGILNMLFVFKEVFD